MTIITFLSRFLFVISNDIQILGIMIFSFFMIINKTYEINANKVKYLENMVKYY